MSRYDWMEDALCAQVDPALFHVDSGGSYQDAKKICGQCPVQQQCSSFAQAVEQDAAHNWRFGVWGGQAPRARAASRRNARRRDTHETILRLTARGGMDAYQIADHVGVDVRTVWRVTAANRKQMGKAA
ncbi:WhiB family transcriptional regulator [Streptomyces sp. NPDC094143]|uniref:WhiB family transcriptional regulator n=1 Tax=Streptomyces sp. NPDC094143 TaxID=3155310 RepID=UPI003324375F